MYRLKITSENHQYLDCWKNFSRMVAANLAYDAGGMAYSRAMKKTLSDMYDAKEVYHMEWFIEFKDEETALLFKLRHSSF